MINSVQQITEVKPKSEYFKADNTDQPVKIKPEVNMVVADLSQKIVYCKKCGDSHSLPSKLYQESEWYIKRFAELHKRCQVNFKSNKK